MPRTCAKTGQRMKKLCIAALTAFLFAHLVFATSEPAMVVQWPSEKPALKVTFGEFRRQASYADQSIYLSDVTVENLSDKQISRVFFIVSLFDRNKVRVGRGPMLVADLDAGQSTKMRFQCDAAGVPASVALTAQKAMLNPAGKKTLPLRIISVPPAAKLTIDGKDNGITPMIVWLTVGSHHLELSKGGYAKSTSLEVTPEELPGSSITIELGGLSRDTIELRDGTVLLGDIVSLSMTDVVVRIDGKDQSYPRNQVKRMMLVERSTEQQPTVVPPPPSSSPQR
jgi:hypothetical protein